MRKKSHIFLSRYLVSDISTQELWKHRKAFYLGSILPDCKPSFLTTKHEFAGTFDMVQDRILALTFDTEHFHRNSRAYMRELGEVIHYIADYFTFPHNATYDGNLKDHCYYEKDLKFGLKAYIKSGQAFADKEEVTAEIESTETLVDFIEVAHKEYLSRKRNVDEDCYYIVRICQLVAAAVLNLVALNIRQESILQFA